MTSLSFPLHMSLTHDTCAHIDAYSSIPTPLNTHSQIHVYSYLSSPSSLLKYRVLGGKVGSAREAATYLTQYDLFMIWIPRSIKKKVSFHK